MTVTTLHPDENETSPGVHLKPPLSPAEAGSSRYSSRFSNIDRRYPSDTVFVVDDATFTSTMTRPSHWSIAWSDLMMTMFILFLSMFVYQTANQEFLQKKTPEIIGGDTTEALQTLDASGATFPFAPISPGLPLMTTGTVKRVERIDVRTLDPDIAFPVETAIPQPKETVEEVEKIIEAPEPSQEIALEPPNVPEKIAILIEKDSTPKQTIASDPLPNLDIIEPRPLMVEKHPKPTTDQFQEIYTMSKGALKDNNLGKFATIDLIPDKTMRIILTGDLLFEVGESELSRESLESLQQITSVIKHTPYMINVVGHTDNVPMRSDKYKSNWELSVARASTVARFLIEKMEIPPNQFVVSGYSSYRPIEPNTTAQNRAINRRVEIIISKRLPRPLPATDNNLN